jgi:hypothetical protein
MKGTQAAGKPESAPKESGEGALNVVPYGISKLFRREDRCRFLIKWTADMDGLYDESKRLRCFVVDVENPSIQDIRRDLLAKMGVRDEQVEGKRKITYDRAAMNLNGLGRLIFRRIQQLIEDNEITNPTKLDEIVQWYTASVISRNQEMGSKSQVVIYDSYRLRNWCNDIAGHCNSLLPVFERLARKEVLAFPFLDKPLQETDAACERLSLFLDKPQKEIPKNQDLRLPSDDPHVGQRVKRASRRKPCGGIMKPENSNVEPGEVIIETAVRTDNDNAIRLEPKDSPEQPSWTVVHFFVSPGDTLQADTKLLTISARNIYVDKKKFLELFLDVVRLCGSVRGMGAGLRELKRVPG